MSSFLLDFVFGLFVVFWVKVNTHRFGIILINFNCVVMTVIISLLLSWSICSFHDWYFMRFPEDAMSIDLIPALNACRVQTYTVRTLLISLCFRSTFLLSQYLTTFWRNVLLREFCLEDFLFFFFKAILKKQVKQKVFSQSVNTCWVSTTCEAWDCVLWRWRKHTHRFPTSLDSKMAKIFSVCKVGD